MNLMNIYKDLLFEAEIKHIFQPTGHSCGPTCLKMVGDFLSGNIPEIDDICEKCGTDWVVGTPPEKMKIGLNYLKIKNIEHINEIEPFQSLRNTIDKGNVAIVRTITHGVPHWIVIHDYNDRVFIVNDPWLGQISYNEKELNAIWKERNYFYYEILSGKQEIAENVQLTPISNEDAKLIYNNLANVFDKTGWSNKQVWDEISHFKADLSVVAKVNNQIAGFYFIGNDQIPPGGKNYEKLKGLNGVEGLALGVLKEFKNKGVGKKLIEYPKTIPNIDYIWGYQLKSLKNIDDWKKRREIYYDGDELYITYQIFK